MQEFLGKTLILSAYYYESNQRKDNFHKKSYFG